MGIGSPRARRAWGDPEFGAGRHAADAGDLRDLDGDRIGEPDPAAGVSDDRGGVVAIAVLGELVEDHRRHCRPAHAILRSYGQGFNDSMPDRDRPSRPSIPESRRTRPSPGRPSADDDPSLIAGVPFGDDRRQSHGCGRRRIGGQRTPAAHRRHDRAGSVGRRTNDRSGSRGRAGTLHRSIAACRMAEVNRWAAVRGSPGPVNRKVRSDPNRLYGSFLAADLGIGAEEPRRGPSLSLGEHAIRSLRRPGVGDPQDHRPFVAGHVSSRRRIIPEGHAHHR